MLTSVLRQSQSSTRGWPAGRTCSIMVELFSSPNKRSPMRWTLLSMCTLWAISTSNSFCAFNLSLEPSGAFSNWNNFKKNSLLNFGIFVFKEKIIYDKIGEIESKRDYKYSHFSIYNLNGYLYIYVCTTTRYQTKNYLVSKMKQMNISLVDKSCWGNIEWFRGIHIWSAHGDIMISRVCTKVCN